MDTRGNDDSPSHYNRNSASPNCALVLCRACDLAVSRRALPSGVRAICPRCKTPLYDTPYCAIDGVLAMCIAALILYIPAMLLPVLEMHFIGSVRTTTVWQGALAVADQGYWVVGLAVLIGAVVGPGLLITSIFAQMLIIKTHYYRRPSGRRILVVLLRYHKLLSQLSMLEIYVISFLVTSFQLSDFADVYFGMGTFCFTMLFLIVLFMLREYKLEHMWGYLNEFE
ncbi:paraquat-inducible protein A [Shewanella yunxiaonensis]|uniref:Paraquat-inducible protein A n=1 Tax=Shewanella yunxiaonensis TaxID=2829809 RepID=A0ABX7YXW0_9GAMM|nr:MULTISPECIES: paraquat-inducible protein A [Shewanella]MDF0535283.1 paraquat-inducible protein A [Shewanella sp. A32]QUN07599.1 paraquat-inducible protein A [Shewanella yunxiaonensis]